jgi:hypothetical protein
MLTPKVKIEIAMRNLLRNVEICLPLMPHSSMSHCWSLAADFHPPPGTDYPAKFVSTR